MSTPAASRRIEEIRFSAEQNVELTVIEAGKFTSPDSGETVIYAREVVGDELRDVFLQLQQDDRVVVILAERGRRILDPVTAEQSFVLYNGRRYEGVPGESGFLVVEIRRARYADSIGHGGRVRRGRRPRSRRSTSCAPRRSPIVRSCTGDCRSRCRCSC